jgi:DnaK suppressor protein
VEEVTNVEDLAQIELTLVERRRELDAELTRLIEPPTEGASVSFGKRVGDGTAEAVERLSTTATARSISTSIDDIDRALAKIEAGTYGVCDGCGAPITESRLEALPSTAVCIVCASRR